MKTSFQTLSIDRFIPYRGHTPSPSVFDTKSASNNDENRLLSSSLHKQIHPPKKYICSKTPSTKEETLQTFLQSLPKTYSKLPISQKPQEIRAYKILGAQDLIDNFYSNLLDWSKQGFVSAGINQSLYLHNQSIQKCIELKRFHNTIVTSTKFTTQGELICCGDEDGYLQIFDVQKCANVRLYRGQKDRLGCMEFTPNNLLISGSKDWTIHIHDLREAQPIVAQLKSHRGQICGLTYKDNYLASGGNDNKVSIWDIRKGELIGKHNCHQSAVKAISWCPYKNNILVSGGGINDKKIVVWNSLTQQKQLQLDQKSQIHSIGWKNSTKQMITAQGRSKGYLITHNTFTQKKLKRKKFVGHKGRILAFCINKIKDNLMCSIGSDEVIRYWNADQNKKCEINQNPQNRNQPDPLQTVEQNQAFVNISQMLR